MNSRIAELNLYPIKGCRGISLPRATLAATGLAVGEIGDREWLLVDADHEFMSQREYPRMALITTRLTGDSLRLQAPGMLTLEVPFASEGEVVEAQVWDDRVAAVTQGEVADAWFGNFLGAPARLLRFDPEARRLASRQYTGGDEAPYKFADAFALLIANTASLADLNAKLAAKNCATITMARFRANIVLDGLAAFEEDYAASLRVNGISIRPVKPCARCTVPGVDPATGVAASEVPDVLASFRRTERGVLFGVNAIVAAGAGSELQVGDQVEVELAL